MKNPCGLAIKTTPITNDYESLISPELSSLIDPFLGLKLNGTFLSETWYGNSKSETKSFHEFLKLEILGKGNYASVYKVYHRPTRQSMVKLKIL